MLGQAPAGPRVGALIRVQNAARSAAAPPESDDLIAACEMQATIGVMTLTSTWAVRGRVVLLEEVLEDGVVVIEGTRIAFVGTSARARAAGYADAVSAAAETSAVITPGFVDVHCHGGFGTSFPDVTDAATARIAVAGHLHSGTTSLVASLVTAAPETLRQRVDVLTELAEAGELAGIHLEGPFLSQARCGAQDPNLMQEPSIALVQDIARIAKGHLVTMTIAAELPGVLGPDGVSLALIESGALPSFGHTDSADGETRAGLEQAYGVLGKVAGRSARPTVTHLFNGMRPLAHREAGPIPECLAAARKGQAVVELVADGTHVHPALVREVFELVGPQNIALVTDSMAAAGMPDGAYRLGSLDVTVKDGVARLTHGGSIAGGTAVLSEVVRTTVEGGVPLHEAVAAATATPAAVLGRTDIGLLEAGRRADIVVFDEDLRVQRVIRAGEPVDAQG